eukprot:1154211_1
MAESPDTVESDQETPNMFEVEQKFRHLEVEASKQADLLETNQNMAKNLITGMNTFGDDTKQSLTETTSPRKRGPPPPSPPNTHRSRQPPPSSPPQSPSTTAILSQKRADFASLNILRKELLHGCDRMNYTHPSKIQAEAIPRCLSDTFPDLIGQAHHGSGKTAAFGLIMLQRVDETIPKLQGLVVVHSRELAIQIYNVCTSLGHFIDGLCIALAIKGKEPPVPWQHQICIGTPGTLIDKVMNRQRRVKGGLESFLEVFKILVIDEADEFMKSDFKTKFKYNRNSEFDSSSFGTLFDQLQMITRVLKSINQSFQILLFSATFPATIKKYAIEIAPKAKIIKVARKNVQLHNVRVFSINCMDDEDKFQTLLNVIKLANAGQMIVFANSVYMAQQLIQALESEQVGIACSALYGRGMPVELRDITMQQFRNNETQCLVASNVIARGIDVPSVGLVVNFEIPITRGHSTETGMTGFTFDSETFMHRVGRTGRFGAKGVCINLVSEDDPIGNDRLAAIQKEYSLDIKELDNSPKAIKESITNWLQQRH